MNEHVLNYPITFKVFVEDSGDAPFVAYVPEFDISSCGKTETEAIHNAREALEITIEEIKKKGKLKEYLDELGLPSHPSAKMQFPKIIIEPFSIAF